MGGLSVPSTKCRSFAVNKVMVVTPPNRLVSGLAFAALFAGVGAEMGYLGAQLLHPAQLHHAHLLFLPAFGAAVWYVRQIWCHGVHTDPVKRLTALPPRLQAVLFACCLALGVLAGAALVQAVRLV